MHAQAPASGVPSVSETRRRRGSVAPRHPPRARQLWYPQACQRAALAATRPRYHVHFTPTYASWLNQVEIWFGIITRKAIRRGSFRSVRELVAKIERFTETYNASACPFVWTATAESILQKLQRLCQRISGTEH